MKISRSSYTSKSHFVLDQEKLERLEKILRKRGISKEMQEAIYYERSDYEKSQYRTPGLIDLNCFLDMDKVEGAAAAVVLNEEVFEQVAA